MTSKYFQKLLSLFKRPSRDDQFLEFTKLLGFAPREYHLYKTAMRHSSVNYVKKLNLESNERLEFLGDAVLELVATEKLYLHYPNKSEGILTRLRVKLVNRSFLNEKSIEIGIPSLLHQYVGRKKQLLKSEHNIYGNALEALIGAIYLDCGLVQSAKFIEDKIFGNAEELEQILSKDLDYKSRLISWCQKSNKKIEFQDEILDSKLFVAKIFINNELRGEGLGNRKKISHQVGSKKVMEELGILDKAMA